MPYRKYRNTGIKTHFLIFGWFEFWLNMILGKNHKKEYRQKIVLKHLNILHHCNHYVVFHIVDIT